MPTVFNKLVNMQPLPDEEYLKKQGFRWLLVKGSANGIPELAAQVINRWKIAHPVPVTVSNVPYVLYSVLD